MRFSLNEVPILIEGLITALNPNRLSFLDLLKRVNLNKK